MRLAEPSAPPPFEVLRASHVEFGVADLERSAAFYLGGLGMVETARDDDTLWLRGLEDSSHHCLVLRRGEPGTCFGIGFRVRSPEDLDRAAEHFKERGGFLAEDEPQGQGRTILARDPFGMPVSFYHRQEQVSRRLQNYDSYNGAAVQRLDHVNIYAAELQATHDYYTGELGFRVSEYTETDGDQPQLWAVW